MATLDVDQAKAHLTVLGWYPVRYSFTYSKRRFVGLRSATQIARLAWGNVSFEMILPTHTFDTCEWWEITDEAILKAAKTIDNTLIGWGE